MELIVDCLAHRLVQGGHQHRQRGEKEEGFHGSFSTTWMIGKQLMEAMLSASSKDW